MTKRSGALFLGLFLFAAAASACGGGGSRPPIFPYSVHHLALKPPATTSVTFIAKIKIADVTPKQKSKNASVLVSLSDGMKVVIWLDPRSPSCLLIHELLTCSTRVDVRSSRLSGTAVISTGPPRRNSASFDLSVSPGRAQDVIITIGRNAAIHAVVLDDPSPGPTDTPSPGPTDSPSPGPTDSPSPGPTDSPSPGPTDSPSPGPSDSPSPSPSPTDTPSPSPSPTDTPSPSPSPTDTPSPSPSPTDTPSPSPSPTPTATPGHISHVIVLIQENRTFDNLFNGFPGADTVQTGTMHDGTQIALKPIGLSGGKNLTSAHSAFLTAYDHGKMDGFDLVAKKGGAPEGTLPYVYVTSSSEQGYWTLAQQYTLADRMFSSQTANSYPAHQYLIRGSSDGIIANPRPVVAHTWGCDVAGQTAPYITPSGRGGSTSTCFDAATLGDLLDTYNISWRYYSPSVGFAGFEWNAYDSIRHIRYGPDWSISAITPETTILSDIANNNLATVSYVVPNQMNSDHEPAKKGSGPNWVLSIVDAIGTSAYWSSTTILVTWDDWGGLFDHVPPPQLDYMGLGARVPLVVVGPYARVGYVSHQQHEFGSILRYIETTFGLPTLGTTDSRADDLSDCFDMMQPPTQFVPIPHGTFAPDYPGQPPPDDDD